jgi:hypothetical protein
MFIKDEKRFSIHQRYTDPATGEKGIDMSRPENRERFGVTEIPDPVRQPDETHYNQEINEAPYLVSTPKPPEMIAAARVAKIDQQIDALERQVMLPRLVREDLMMRFLEAAAGAGITEAQLLDPQHAAYSPGYAKMHGFNAQIVALRAQR